MLRISRTIIGTLAAAMVLPSPSFSDAALNALIPTLKDCQIVSYVPQTRNPTDENSREYVILGAGKFDWQGNWTVSPTNTLPSHHRQTLKCAVYKTIPATKQQIDDALNNHLDSINTAIRANTVEVQQTVAQSFAIQIDVLASEIAEIRSLLSGVDEQDAAVIGARLDSLEARLDALTQIANN